MYVVRDKEIRTPLTRATLSGTRVPRVALPRHTDDGALLRFLRSENLPGYFPFTAGVFPFKRKEENPARDPLLRRASLRARRGRSGAHQPALPPALRRATGDAALDRLRLRHPLWPQPGPATRRLWQGRHERRERRHP